MAEPLERLTAALADRYRIERELGAGGMATVYLAEDLKHHRKVAVKVLRPDLAASLGPERFLREVTIAANLQHPHVLPLYDSGQTDGFLFYVMPYVEGTSLRQKLLREGELPISDAVRILRDVADAMAYAHQHGVVHRDIKPENVMLSGRHALVTDFGVAKAVSEATGRQTLTTAGVALGTPTYMAPEQAAADPHTDHRADLYAFGVLAYEMLTGRPPFVAGSPQAVLAAHVTTAAEPVTQHRASIPPVLADLVMRCLEKKPADRWQNAEELLPQLEAVLTPSGGMTPTATVPVRATSPRRAWRPAAVMGIGVLVLLAAVVGRRREVRPIMPAEGGRVAVFPFSVRSADSMDHWLGEGLAQTIGSRLTRASGLRVISMSAVVAQLARTPDPLEAAKVLKARWAITGQLQRDGNRIQGRTEIAVADSGLQLWSTTFQRVDGSFQLLEAEVAESVTAILAAGSASPATRGISAVRVDPEAYRLFLLGNAQLNRRTPQSAIQAAASFQEAVRRDPRFADGWSHLARTRMIQYSWGGWRTDVPRDSLPTMTNRAATTALALDSLNVMGLAVLGQLASWVNGDVLTARRLFNRALSLDSLNAEVWHTYGVVLGAENENDLPAAERALRISIRLDPDRPNTWRHLGMAVASQGRLREAEAILDTTAAFAPWSPAYYDRGYYRFLQGNARGALEDLHAAEQLTGRVDSFAMALFAIASGDSVPARGWLQGADRNAFAMARMLVALGRRQDALSALERGANLGLGRPLTFWATLHNPIFAGLRSDPRFRQLLERSRPPGVN